MVVVKELMTKDFLKIDKRETVGKLIGRLKKSNKRAALVFDEKKFLGIVRKIDLIRSKVNTEKAKIAKFVKHIAKLSEDTELINAAYIMFNVDTNVLPVEKKGKIIGVVSIFDIIKQIRKFEPIKHFMIREVAYEGVVGVDENERIGSVIHLMHKLHSYDIPVLRDGKLTGIISVSDIFNRYLSGFPIKRETRAKSAAEMRSRGFEAERPEIDALPVKGFDTGSQQYTLEITDKLAKAVDVMCKRDVMCVVATKNDKPVGVLTANNVLRALAALYEGPDFNIRFIGLKKTQLEPYQKFNMQQIVENEAAKLKHYIHGDFVLEVRVKEHKKQGKRQKYSIQMKMIRAGKTLTSSEHDWDIETAIRKNINNLKKQIMHTFKEDNS